MHSLSQKRVLLGSPSWADAISQLGIDQTMPAACLPKSLSTRFVETYLNRRVVPNENVFHVQLVPKITWYTLSNEPPLSLSLA